MQNPAIKVAVRRKGTTSAALENLKVGITDDWYPGIVVSVESPRNGEVTKEATNWQKDPIFVEMGAKETVMPKQSVGNMLRVSDSIGFVVIILTARKMGTTTAPSMCVAGVFGPSLSSRHGH